MVKRSSNTINPHRPCRASRTKLSYEKGSVERRLASFIKQLREVASDCWIGEANQDSLSSASPIILYATSESSIGDWNHPVTSPNPGPLDRQEAKLLNAPETLASPSFGRDGENTLREDQV